MKSDAFDIQLVQNKPGTNLLITRLNHVLVQAVAVLVVSLLLFALVQWATPGIVGNDGYYHIKMAYLMRREGLTPAFEALPFTILNSDAYYDHHMLFHLFLTPFAGVDPAIDGGAALTQGGKIATVILPALAVVAIWWLLRGQQVPFSVFWAIVLFAVSEAFLYRMSMVRAQSGALLLLVLGLHWLLTGRYRLLAVLGFVFVWFYNAFPLLLVLVGVYTVAIWLLERRVVWPAVGFTLLGLGLGLIINPYFPENLTFIAGHLLPKINQGSIPVGNEWSPYRTWTLVQNSGFALAAFLLGVLAIGWRQERIDRSSLVALGLVVVFGYALFQSRRFVEYFPAFALIFLAFSSAPIIRDWQKGIHARARVGNLAPVVLAIAVMLAMVAITIKDARALVADSKPPDQYAKAMLWLRHEAGPGVTIFQTDWDDFTRQFFYFDQARYINGLDPTFMQQYDADLYELWVDITHGRIDAPGKLIRERFGAEYVFSDLHHEKFLRVADDDPRLIQVYKDEFAVIYSIRTDQ